MNLSIREKIISELFNYITHSCNYVIFHHVDEVFLTNSDIDFGVDCDKDKLLQIIIDFCIEFDTRLINVYKIDQEIFRFDMMFRNEVNLYELIELDCACNEKATDLLLLDVQELLKNKKVVEVKGCKFYTISSVNEINFYIKKKAFKRDNIFNYKTYLQNLKSTYNDEEIAELFNNWIKYFNSSKFKYIKNKNKISLLFNRISNNASLSISFLGPDGSGKTTIIDLLMSQNYFRHTYYFHLKPIKKDNGISIPIDDPHASPVYSKVLSYIKLLYFIYQYNMGWMTNILKLKIKSSLIIFDRYYDDVLVDNKRYRYGGSLSMVKFIRNFIPKPDIYFILTTEPSIIYKRKQEVSFDELERQVESYRTLADGKRYFNIDVNRKPEEIVEEIITIMMDKMNERY